MAYKSYEKNTYTDKYEKRIATNSLTIATGDLVSEASGFWIKAVAGGLILWVSDTSKTFASDNQTVAKDVVLYTPTNDEDTWVWTASAASLAQADVGSYFDIVNTTQLVDYASKSASTGQLKLEKVISTTVWVFKIVNM